MSAFGRALMGLDSDAAKAALPGFVGGKALTANQIEFVNLLVEHLTARGALDAGVLYESPFTDVAPQGPDDLFPGTRVAPLVEALERVRANATA